MKKLFSMLAILAATTLTTQAQSSTWTADKVHSSLSFEVTHMLVTDVDGLFKNIDTKVTASKSDFSDAVFELTADVNSINTDNEKRDAHLKSPDFFDATKYATLSFKSKSVKVVGKGILKVTGDLTIHGITKVVVLDATYRTGTNIMSKKDIAGFKVTGTINRADFALGNSIPTAVVGNEVTIKGNVEYVKD